MRKLMIAFVGTALCTAAASARAQQPVAGADSTTITTTSPVAWVYVSSVIGTTNKSEVYGYSVASTGKLTPLPGSPYAADINSMAVNGKYLFGSVNGGTDIDTYLMQSDGALTYAATTDVLTPNKGCGSAGSIFLDHTGASLYNFDYSGSNCANNTYEAYGVVKDSGKLTYLGETGGDEELNGPLTLIGNNEYAYSSDCYHFDAAIYGFRRNSNGTLTTLNINPAYPKTAAGVSGWCPYLAAADPTDHLAIPMFPSSGYGDQNGPYQLAVYTVGSTGNMTTTSTYATMPKVAVGGITDLSMAPSGKLLAVGGSGGLQIFHFNGASPITAYTGLLTTDYINQMYWDNANHLFAISESGKKMWVYTITPTGYNQAPGSPYSINSPLGVIVQPLPRY